jgi:hypothetical protein
MIIFIPVLVICMNSNCEFMQAKTYYSNDAQCRAVLDVQKKHMLELATEAKTGKVEHIEGTCIEADIKSRPRSERDI